MPEEQFSTEKRILRAMRRTLARVVCDLTPPDSAVRYPLSDETVQDIKLCFDLIASRERELAQAAGRSAEEKPRFIDEPQTSKMVPMQDIQAKRGDNDE